MKINKLIPYLGTNTLRCGSTSWNLPIFYSQGHAFIILTISTTFFTRTELTRLHSHFFHPSAEKLSKLLRRAHPVKATTGVKEMLQQITIACKNFGDYSSRHYRFRVSMPPKEIIFNHEVSIDLLWLDIQPVLRVVCTHTHPGNAVWIKSKTAERIWKTFVECWSTLYVGHPRKIEGDCESAVNSNRFYDITMINGIDLQLSPVESHNSIGIGERYHAPI